MGGEVLCSPATASFSQTGTFSTKFKLFSLDEDGKRRAPRLEVQVSLEAGVGHTGLVHSGHFQRCAVVHSHHFSG